jgi:hypothetical protein
VTPLTVISSNFGARMSVSTVDSLPHRRTKLPLSHQCEPDSIEHGKAVKREREHERYQTEKAIACLAEMATGIKRPKTKEEGYENNRKANDRKANISKGLTSKGMPRRLCNAAWHVKHLGQMNAYDFSAAPRKEAHVRRFMYGTVRNFMDSLKHQLDMEYEAILSNLLAATAADGT